MNISLGSHTFCFFFNIDDFSYTQPIEYTDKCLSGLEKFKTYYFKKTNNFIFACGGQYPYYKLVIFNNEKQVLVDSEIN